MTFRLLLSFLLYILFVSCQQKATEHEAQSPENSADSIATTHLVSTIPDSTISSQSDQPASPAAVLQSDAIRILPTGTFHGDEVEEGVEQIPWFGLFTDDQENFVLRKTKIIARRVVDGLLDDEEKGEMTGWEIGTENGESPTILISGGDLSEGIVQASEIPAMLYPGDSSRVEFKGIHYLFYATGYRQSDSLSGVTYVSDYTLHVVRTDKGKSLSTVLVSHASFDDAMTSILWGGDLDRDGYMDLLIDMSRHYNVTLPTLFLSEPAGEDVVVPVAEHESVGC